MYGDDHFVYLLMYVFCTDVTHYIPAMVPEPGSTPPSDKAQYEPQEGTSSHPGRKIADPHMFQKLTQLPRTAPTGQEEMKQAPIVPAVPKTKRPHSAQLTRATDPGHSARTGASSRRTEGSTLAPNNDNYVLSFNLLYNGLHQHFICGVLEYTNIILLNWNI